MIIRLITPADQEALLPLLTDLLAASCDAGSRLQPTPKNVETLLAQALEGAAAGDPCLVAVADDGTLQGAIIWKGCPVAADHDGTICYGLGTVVAPAARRTGVSRALREQAATLARERGYTVVLGAAYDGVALQACTNAGFNVVGVLVEKPLC